MDSDFGARLLAMWLTFGDGLQSPLLSCEIKDEVPVSPRAVGTVRGSTHHTYCAGSQVREGLESEQDTAPADSPVKVWSPAGGDIMGGA